ncbi:Lrp/AsnC family transcriptional regulator [Natronorarus salvus]|uniref:Lrp/AsnC family transcriptional regulator n=1 Tax=Natronorarus salvus TaxID=3117733 RepID=UPI002F26AF66
MVTEKDRGVILDDVDRAILHELQRDARRITHEEISAEVGVSQSTVRNRIAALEETGVIKSYAPEIDYERAGFSLHVQFVCTAPMEDRHRIAREALEVGVVVTVQEMVTSERNLIVRVIATNSHDLTEITRDLGSLDMRIHSSEIVTNTYTQPFNYFESSRRRSEADGDDAGERSTEPDT